MKLSLQHLNRIYDPLNPISSEKLNQIIYTLIEQIDTLTKIANEFSSFAKMPKEHLIKMDIIPILKNTILLFQNENAIKIEFVCNLNEAIILGDKNLILQVFNNIVNNSIQALNFIENGHIIIDINENESNFLVSFFDNGKGIQTEMIDKIFQPNFTTKSTGSGLGLALCKQIIIAHKGKIKFETEINKFTRFIIELPKFN